MPIGTQFSEFSAMSLDDLPLFNSFLNGLAFLFLTIGFVAIKMKKTTLHRAMMMSALSVSALFLVFYVWHKIHVGGVHTPFRGEGVWRYVYLTMLFSHIVLAMGMLPMILVTFKRAIQGRFEAHRRLARWTFPIWYYVSITGVLVYCFLYVWFQ